MKFRNKSFFIDILNKVKEKMLYPLKLIPVLKSNITIISIGVVSLFIFFIVAPDLWYYFIDILKTVLRVLLFIVVMYYTFTNMPFWYLYKYSELDNPKTPDEKRRKLRDEIVHYEARWIVFLIIILILVIVRKFTNFFF